VLERDRDLALGAPDQAVADDALEGGVRELGGDPDALDLLGVLDGPNALDQSAGRDQLHAFGQQLPHPHMLSHRYVRVVEAEPDLARRNQVDDRIEQVGRGLHPRERGVDLFGRLLDVAKVGHEGPRAGPNEGDPAGAVEAGEVADVYQVAHQQHVDLLVSEKVCEPLDPPLHCASSSRRRASASRYPSGPRPLTWPMQTSRITESRRHSSRASISERWTSIAGNPVSSSASRIAHA